MTTTDTTTPSLRATTPALPALVSDGLGCAAGEGGWVDYANLDHGASTPALVDVAEEVARAAVTYSSVHRGKGFASQVSSWRYEDARATVAAFVGARAGDHVIFTRNTTDSFNLLAGVVPAGGRVFAFASEHHAALLPWAAEQVVRLPIPRSHDAALASLEQALVEHPAEHRLVVVTGASNVTGEYWPVAQIAALAARYGARVALDAAQLAPHDRIDITALGVDYVAFSGHKIYAPFGAGVLVGRGDWLDAAAPYLAGGGATARVGLEETEWTCGPARHEAGSPNVLGVVALARACELLTEHHDAIVGHEGALRAQLLEALSRIPAVTVHTLFDGSAGAPVATFTVEGVSADEVAQRLSDAHGIGVRDGKFCAHLLVDALLEGSGHDRAVRVSAGLGTTSEHIERLATGLRSITTPA